MTGYVRTAQSDGEKAVEAHAFVPYGDEVVEELQGGVGSAFPPEIGLIATQAIAFRNLHPSWDVISFAPLSAHKFHWNGILPKITFRALPTNPAVRGIYLAVAC